jgi:hypothetical protein
MKKLTLLFMCCVATFLSASAQTQGTNTLGAGFSSSTYDDNSNGIERRTHAGSLGYGHFIKDNLRLSITGSYGYSKYTNTPGGENTLRSTGAGLTLQKYFPLVKKFYAFAGANGFYERRKTEGNGTTQSRGNGYFLGASGGASYFLSKRFALEVDVLSAGLNYTREKHTDNSAAYTSSNFSLSTTGNVTNLGFRVYLLF